MFDDAEKALQVAIHMKADAAKIARATSDLGDIYYHQGKIDGAKQYWDTAIKANGKLVGARVNTASLEIEQMRKINNPKDANWQKLQDDVKFQLSSALGVNSESVEAYTDYGLLYLEGWQQNKNRLDLAKLLLDEANKRNAKYAALQNAYGLYYLHRGSLNDALTHFSAAVESDPKFVEARMNVGETVLGFRKYDVAKDNFSKVLELQPKNYDAMIGLGRRAARPQRLRRRRGERQEGQGPRWPARRGVLQPRRAVQGVPRDQGQRPGSGEGPADIAGHLSPGVGLLQAVPRQGRRRPGQDRGEEQHGRLRQGHQADG